eukprot:scaffold230437_cov35-Attheya_sp.AAC.1
MQLKQIRSYVGGHIYPLMWIAEKLGSRITQQSKTSVGEPLWPVYNSIPFNSGIALFTLSLRIESLWGVAYVTATMH